MMFVLCSSLPYIIVVLRVCVCVCVGGGGGGGGGQEVLVTDAGYPFSFFYILLEFQ